MSLGAHNTENIRVSVFYKWRHIGAAGAIIIPVAIIAIAGLHSIALLRGAARNTAWDGVVIPRYDSGAIDRPGASDAEQGVR
jgi:hypothetical protein